MSGLGGGSWPGPGDLTWTCNSDFGLQGRLNRGNKAQTDAAAALARRQQSHAEQVVRSYPLDFCVPGLMQVLGCSSNFLYKPTADDAGKCLLERCGRPVSHTVPVA